MSFYNRFSNLFSTVEIELAHSLPILTLDKEIVFFYEERENKDHKRVVGDIKYIAIKNIKDGKENQLFANEIVPREINNGIKGTILNDELSVEEELQQEDNYIDLYNQLFTKAIESSVTAEEINYLFDKLKETLNFKSLYSLYEFLFIYTFDK